MPAPTATPTSAREPRTGVNAVVWIERGRALLVRGMADGEPAIRETFLPHQPTALLPALAALAHAVGRVDRVLVLGADDLRFALEREIVAIGHRPETIREADLDGPVDARLLLARLRSLA